MPGVLKIDLADNALNGLTTFWPESTPADTQFPDPNCTWKSPSKAWHEVEGGTAIAIN